MLTKQFRQFEQWAEDQERTKALKKQTNYWVERFNNLPNYIVVGRDMDGVTGYTVIHKKDESEWNSSCYRSEIMHGLSMNKSDMQKLADEMNNK